MMILSVQPYSLLIQPFLLTSLLLLDGGVVEASGGAYSSSSSRRSNMPYLRLEDLPVSKNREDWKPYDNQGSSFLPADNVDPRLVERFLSDQLEEENDDNGDHLVYGVQPFASGMEEYDEYQQAWRLLGFMVDCNVVFDDDDNDYGSNREGCYRYVLWAAYVDLEYQGGGIGEYQYWDRRAQEWDDSSCANNNGGNDDGNNNGSGRCAKMDCHLEDTHFSLLGFFKHISYDDFMEQLFKHEGVCVWTEEEYAFMKNAREAWPQACTASSATTAGGEPVYYDLKPTTGGGITIGLYTDSLCVEEYDGGADADGGSVTPETVLGNIFLDAGSGDNGDYDFSGDSLEDSLDRWDSAFGVFHVCQPCIAYDLNNTDGMQYYDDDDNNNNNNNYYYNNNNNYYYNGGGGDPFDCYDDADYTNVNQCMKFMAKTDMNTATFRDLSLARYQGTLVASPFSGFPATTNASDYLSRVRQTLDSWTTYLGFFFSLLTCLYGKIYFSRMKRLRNNSPRNKHVKEPIFEK